MIYRAFANGKEITDFPISGVNTNAIYGGNTLLWEKESGGMFSGWYVRNVIHCGQRSLLSLTATGENKGHFYMIATPKKSNPYYEKVYEIGAYNGYVCNASVGIFNEELYVMEWSQAKNVVPDSTNNIQYIRILGFYIYSSDMKLKSYFKEDYLLEFDKSKDSQCGAVVPYKMWVENNRFHLICSYCTSESWFDRNYKPLLLETLVFEEGELIERQQSPTLNCNYKYDSYDGWCVYTTTISSEPHNGNYYYIATEGVGYNSDSRLTEVSTKEPSLKVLSGTQGNYRSYYAGNHNGKSLWRRNESICELVGTNYAVKCRDSDYSASRGFVPYGNEYLCLGFSNTYPTVRISKGGAVSKNDVVYASNQRCIDADGIIIEDGTVFVYSRPSALATYCDIFKI